MKKKLAFILAVVMMFSCISGMISVSAAAPVSSHSIALNAKLLNVQNEGADTSFGIWGGEATTEAAYSGSNAIKLVGNGSYANYEMWSGGGNLSKDNTYVVSFYVKGTAGTSVSFDFEGYGGDCSKTSYTLAGSDWEKVEFAFTPTVAPNVGDHTTNGYPFRVYTQGSDTFYIDDVAIWSTQDVEEVKSVTVDEWVTNWSFDSAADDTDRGSWTMDGSDQTTPVDGASGQGTKLTKKATYSGIYFWSGNTAIVKNSDSLVTFYVKGTAGETVMYDFDDGAIAGGSHTFATNDWEYVAFVVNPSADPGNASCGYSFRVYGAVEEFCFDELHIATLEADPVTLTDLVTLEENADGGFVELQSKKSKGGYGALYIDSVPMTSGTEYTLTVDVMTNNTALNPMFDLEGQAGVGAASVAPTAAETWETKTLTFTPNATGSFPVRIYLNEDVNVNEGEVLVKNLTVKAGDETVASFSGKEATRVAENAKYYEYSVPVVKSNLFELDSCKDGGFEAFQPTANNGYAAYYMRAKLDANKEYTLKFKAISNIENATLMVDLEGNGGMDTTSVIITDVDTWKEYTVTVKATSKWADSSNEGIAEMGWPLRIYFNTPVEAQIFIDDISLTDGSTTVLAQDFAKGIEIEGVAATWHGGNATYIPAGYVPEKEGEVLGYNELINGDFEDASLMKYWWNRTDWNGGAWAREEGMGYNGTAGLVARGTGAGNADQNAGVFYTIMGEGKEASLDLEAGKTYVLTYKVFRPAGVDSYTYIDINEGQVATAAASLNGEWETVTARFVAPEGVLKIRAVSNALAEGEYVIIDDVELRQVGGDPNGNPKTGDTTPVAFLVVLAVVSVGACAVIVLRKKLAK